MKLALPAPWQYVYPIHRGDNLSDSDHEPSVMKLCLDKKIVSLPEKVGLAKLYYCAMLHGIKRRRVI